MIETFHKVGIGNYFSEMFGFHLDLKLDNILLPVQFNLPLEYQIKN